MTAEDRNLLSSAAVGRSTVIVILGVVGAQAAAIVRELFLATHVGLAASLDAALIALALPTLVGSIISSGTSGALAPVYLRALATNGHRDARQFAGTVVVLLGAVGALASLALVLFAPALIAISGPGLSEFDRDQAVVYLRQVSPVAFMTVLLFVLRMVCQMERQFTGVAIATIVGPVASLAVMLALWERLQLGGLVLGTVVGSFASLVVLLVVAARVSALPIPNVRRDPRLGPWARHAAPVTVSAAILEVRGIADRAIASLLGPGAVSALRYASVLLQPFSQIGPAWSSVLYPRLVQATLHVTGGNLAEWADRSLRSAFAIFVPIATLTVAVAPLAVTVAYGRGEFTAEDLRLTAGALAAYAPTLVTLMMLPVLTGAHNARRRGGLMLAAGGLNVLLNIALNVAFAYWFGVVGIALSTSVAEIVVVVYLLRALRRSEDGFDLRPMLRTFGLALFAIAPFAIGIGIISWSAFDTTDTLTALAALAAAGIVGVIGYATVAYRLGIAPVRALVVASRRQLVRDRSGSS